MILQEIEIENFRSFYSTQSMVFSEHENRNVTLVYAENGIGKTNLLNALLWVFHEEFTGNFDKPNELINHYARKIDNTNTCRVTVRFRFKENDYKLNRIYDIRTRKSVATLFQVSRSGAQTPIALVNPLINQAFPKSMAKYFFFDGEFAVNFAKQTANSGVKKAIQDIVGTTAAQNGLSDIDGLIRKITNEINKKTADNKINEVKSKIEDAERKLQQCGIRLDKIPDELTIYNAKKEAADNILRDNKETSKHQADKNRLENEIKQIENAIDHHLKLRKDWITRNCLAIVSKKVADKCYLIYEKLERTAQIPAPYNVEFVNALLAKKKCICGHPILPSTKEYTNVHSLISNAPDSESQRNIIKVKSFVSRINKSQYNYNDLLTIDRQIAVYENKQVEANSNLKEVNSKLKSSKDINLKEQADIQMLSERKIKQLNDEMKSLEDDKNLLLQEKGNLSLQLSKLATADKTINKLSNELSFLELARDKLNNEIENLNNSALETIKELTNQLMVKILHKNLYADISSNYEISLKDENGTIFPLSSGEGQILSLAFMSSLIKFCASRESDKNILLSPGTVAPFVLDSPFGQLGNEYKKEAVRFLPEFSKQLILFLSSSQGNSETVEVLKEHVGEECAFIRHNKSIKPKEKNKDPDTFSSINGQLVTRTKWSCEHDSTHIEHITSWCE